MNDYQPPQVPPQNVQPPAKSNKLLWIILASVIGMVVIAMGGCMACGALIGLSNLASSNSDSEATDEPESPSKRRDESSAPSAPGTLSGTTWKGSMNCDDGETVPVVLRFAESGGPIYDYQTRDHGLQEVELTSSGQIVRFIPPGGGVTTVQVDSLSVSSNRVSQSVIISYEGGSGTLEQSQKSISTDMSLSGQDLDVETRIRSQSTISQPGIVVPGDERVIACGGKLRQE